MKTKNEKVPGFDEIIFENRNKEYGAFDLRKRYLPTTCLSILGGAAIFSALVIILSLSMETKLTAGPPDTRVVVFKPQSFIDPNKIVVPEPKKPEIIPVSKNLTPVIVEDTAAINTNIPTADDLNKTVTNGTVTINDSVTSGAGPVMPVETPPAIFVEEMPVFPGGDAALMKFINENIKFPEEAINNNMMGTVVIRFVVSSDGSVKRVEVLKGVHPVLDQEAVRVVSLLPRWKPGRQNGNAVPVFYFVPVNFKIKYN
jgi:protein TonB